MNRGIEREVPGPGQESVWDYPRPPALQRSDRHLVVRRRGVVVAETSRAFRVLETSHPPSWYFPPSDVDAEALTKSQARSTVCEWKGAATYWDVLDLQAAAWSYPHPTGGFADIRDHLAFSARQLECVVDGELVRPQEGGFYGGWITDDVAGPFKGAPGTWGW